MARGPQQEILFSEFAGGLATRIENNKIEDNQSPDLQNVIFDGAGYVQPRHGQSLFGVSTSASGSITTCFTAVNSLDQEVPVRMISTYGEYWNQHTAAWENLDDGYRAGLKYGTASYDYYQYYCNQVDHQRRYSAVIGQISTYADSSYSHLVISASAASALGFLSAGTVVVGGEEAYFSAYGGAALSGMTLVHSHSAGEAITMHPTSAGEVPAPDGGWAAASDGLPKGNIMFVHDAVMNVAGASAISGNILYYSTVDAPTNYTISATPGGAGTARYPETLGSITAVNEFDEVLTLMKNNTLRQLKYMEVADGTAGILEIVDRKHIVTTHNIGAVTNESLAKVENDIIYCAPSGWVRTLQVTRDGRKSLETSINIRPTVEGLNMTKSAGIYFDGKYYLACATSDATDNNLVLVYDYDFKAWSKFIGWNVASWYIFKGELHYGASNEIATYKALQNFDDEGFGYNSYYNTKLMDFGIPNELKSLNMIYVEGFITENAILGVSAYFDGDVSAPTSKSIDGSNTDYVSVVDTQEILGRVVWGAGVQGGGSEGSQFNLRKFRWYGKYSGKNFYNLQIKVGSASPGYVWRVTHVGPYLRKIPGKYVPIARIK